MDNEYIRLEAKTFTDTRSNSQNMLKVFGEILKGRNLSLALNNKSNFPIYYGLLFREEDIEIINNLIVKITSEDWQIFGKMFDCKYVYVYDCDSKLDIINWNDFYKTNK